MKLLKIFGIELYLKEPKEAPEWDELTLEEELEYEAAYQRYQAARDEATRAYYERKEF